jgi:CubicO group peptidase (beta-lactamase class C family)
LTRAAIGVAALSLGLLLSSCVPKAPPPLPPLPPPAEPWPTQGWMQSTPEAQGIDSNSLADAIERLRAQHLPVHSLLLERNGFIVLDAYFFPFADAEPHDVASVTKSVISTLTGIALGEHKIESLDQPIAAYLPGAVSQTDDPRKAHITLAHLLSMTSGLDCNAPPGESLLGEMQRSPDWATFMLARPLASDPGTTFVYCGGAIHLVSVALTHAVAESTRDFAQRALFDPLGIRAAAWPSDPQGASHGWGDLELQPRDMAKLGYLWLHHGIWAGAQIVPADYMTAALSPHASVESGITYGYGIWLYPGHTPFDFEANGRGGQRITIVPSENLVEVLTSGGADANRVNPLIASAIRSDFPLPPNPQGDARLALDVAGGAALPKGFAPQPLPQLAVLLDRETYALSANPLHVSTLAFDLASPSGATIRFGFADGSSEEHPVGLDGVPRRSINAASGLPVAVLGEWRNGGFDLSYDEIARINAFTLHMMPSPAGLSVRITERSGLVDAMAQAVTVPKQSARASLSRSAAGLKRTQVLAVVR